jgi:hypothetical protein
VMGEAYPYMDLNAKYGKLDARPPKIGKNKIFWSKIVIFHTKYPNNFRASLCIWKKI